MLHFSFYTAFKCYGGHVERLCVRRTFTTSRQPGNSHIAKVILYFVWLYIGGWKEQDCGSLPPSYESTQRVSSIA